MITKNGMPARLSPERNANKINIKEKDTDEIKMLIKFELYRAFKNNEEIMSLEELIKNRQGLIEAHRKNNFTDGIHALLTDLYPDTAHFIYEL